MENLLATSEIGRIHFEPVARIRFVLCSEIIKIRAFYESLSARDFDEMLEHHARSLSTAVQESNQSYRLQRMGGENGSVYLVVDGNNDDAIEPGIQDP